MFWPQKMVPVRLITRSPLKSADNKFCLDQLLKQIEELQGKQDLSKILILLICHKIWGNFIKAREKNGGKLKGEFWLFQNDYKIFLKFTSDVFSQRLKQSFNGYEENASVHFNLLFGVDFT